MTSLNTINSLRKIGLKYYESRKCTFRINDDFSKLKFSHSINECLNFELDWLIYKKHHYQILSDFDEKRILSIEKRMLKCD